MKRIASLVFLAFVISACSDNRTPAGYVDPFIGTGFHGHTYPGATVPFGMVQLSPDTRIHGWDGCSGYHYSDSTIIGFSHTHLSGTGCADLADILVRPSVSKPEFVDGLFVKTPLGFSHESEEACPGYYRVDLAEEGIVAELTARPRTGVHKYTFTKGGVRHILIDLIHSVGDQILEETDIQVVSESEVCGMKMGTGWTPKQYVYFNARFSEPYADYEMVGKEQILLMFDEDVESLEIAVGISSVSAVNAAENSLADAKDIDFAAARKAAMEDWDAALSDIVVHGGTDEQKTIFYTAQYHTKVAPNLMSDVNGMYRRNDGSVSSLGEGESYYSTLSLWDTFRTWNPLQTIVNPELVNNMIVSMLDMYDATGELPIWPLSSGETKTMIGYHAVSVIADAYCKGIRGFDAGKALEAMVRSSNINAKASDLYLGYGYVPSDMKMESVSLTLEYAYDDWCIARMAEIMGKSEIADEYYRRALNYMNVYDGKSGFFRGRRQNGGWTEPFEPFATGRDYTEATPWHYRFFAPHDIRGMEQLFGGAVKFEREIDDLFHLETEMEVNVSDVSGFMGQYAHGNEPGHHMAYLYSYIGKPWKTQELTRELLDVMYNDRPDGIIGNEDCGQMSAWYVMSSLGFYPVCPGTDQFVLTTPLFPYAEINLPGGGKFIVKADGADRKRYVRSVMLNGKPLDKAFITYDQIMAGGELVFNLSARPVAGCRIEAPYSMTTSARVSAPYTSVDPELFENEIYVDLATATDDAEILYSVDGGEPSLIYTEPIPLDRSVRLRARAFKDGYEPSPELELNITKAEYIAPARTSASEGGTAYRYYEGNFYRTDEIAGKPVADGFMPVPDISAARQEDHFAFIFNGYLDIGERGVWEFMTKSDDGSVLFIDGIKVVDNDGSHAAVSASGRIALDKGFHSFELKYIEDYEGHELEWAWKAPSSKMFTEIPASKIYRK